MFYLEIVLKQLQMIYKEDMFGGIVDSATISASEGGMLMMSYDSVPFLDMVHNQEDQATVVQIFLIQVMLQLVCLDLLL